MWTNGAHLGWLLLATLLANLPATGEEARPAWQTLGLLRVRDMTPFGLTRLDMLPAHSVQANPGTLAFELNLSYQNTWALSDNVREYLDDRGLERTALGPAEIDDILALPGDAYLVDGEFGLADLTLHYRWNHHLGLYATLPYYTFDSRFLDSTIESFHGAAGFTNAGRENVPLDRFLVVADLAGTRIVQTRLPDSELGDPVLGLRLSLAKDPSRRNIVVEAAAKIASHSEQRLVSSGANDYGVQVSFQRFFRRNALYLSLAGVYFASPDPGLAADQWIPTLVAGWETRLTRRLNFVLQSYVSRSVVQETPLDELSAEKIQATLGLQWLHRGYGWRLGITENIANFNNTPDVGVSLSVGRILFNR